MYFQLYNVGKSNLVHSRVCLVIAAVSDTARAIIFEHILPEYLDSGSDVGISIMDFATVQDSMELPVDGASVLWGDLNCEGIC